MEEGECAHGLENENEEVEEKKDGEEDAGNTNTEE